MITTVKQLKLTHFDFLLSCNCERSHVQASVRALPDDIFRRLLPQATRAGPQGGRGLSLRCLWKGVEEERITP